MDFNRLLISSINANLHYSRQSLSKFYLMTNSYFITPKSSNIVKFIYKYTHVCMIIQVDIWVFENQCWLTHKTSHLARPCKTHEPGRDAWLIPALPNKCWTIKKIYKMKLTYYYQQIAIKISEYEGYELLTTMHWQWCSTNE